MNQQKISTMTLLMLFFLFFCSPPAQAQDSAHLFIKTTPKDAAIRILNLSVPYSQGMEIKSGTYLIRISMQGYEAQTKKITIADKGDFTLAVALTPQSDQSGQPPETTRSAAPPAPEEPEQAQTAADTGRLFVQADPPDAVIRILRIKPVFQQGIELEPGNYLVEVSKEGYATKKREVTIKKGQDTKVEIALFLKADMGKLYVNTDPMDATVRLPHIKPKYDPGMELSPGDYTVEITKEGFKTVTTDVKILDGKIARLNVTLKPLSAKDQAESNAPGPQEEPPPPQNGTLTIQLAPEDAEVRILDIDKPYTPEMELASGFYVVEAKKNGYVTATSKVAIKPDQPTTISIALAREPGQAPEPALKEPSETTQSEAIPPGKERLYVDTVPADAQVRVLNIEPKYTQGLEVGPGKYEVEVKKEGLDKKVETVEVLPGEHARATIDLTKGQSVQAPEPETPKTGSLVIDTNIFDPDISIDGKSGYGKEIELAPGEYVVEVSGKIPGQKNTVAKKFSTLVSAGKQTTADARVAPEQKTQPKEANAPDATQQKRSTHSEPQLRPPMDKDTEKLRQSAVEAIQQEDYEQALQLVRQALALGTPEAASYTLLGEIYSLLEYDTKALEAHNLAVKLAPGLATTYAARGKTYVRLNDTESACYDFWKACSLGKCKEISLAKKDGICR